MSDVEREDAAEFERVAALVRTGKVKNLDQTDQLRLYGLYCVATKGIPDDTVPVPSPLNFRATAKYSAWKEASTLLKSREQARRAYIRLVGELQDKKPSKNKKDDKRNESFAKAAPTGFDLGRTADGKDKIDICHFSSLGDIKSVVYLLEENNVDVNFCDEESLTPLMRAADRGHLFVCDVLLEHSANTSITDTDGMTALHYAALCGHADVAGVLIINGAPIEATDNDGNTALQLAADDRTKEVMQLAAKGEWKRPPKKGQGVVENAHIVGLIAVLGVIGILLSLFTSPSFSMSIPISISSWFKKQ